MRNLPEPAQSGQSIHARQTHVKDNCLRGLSRRQLESFLGRRGDGDLVPFARQRALECPAHGLFVVDDQDVTHRLGSG